MSMRVLFAAVLASALALAVIGCSKQPQQTKAVKVENPPEKTTPTQAAKPAPPPAPAPPAAAKPAPAPKGFTKTASGLQYKDVKVGKGQPAKAGDTVTVQYKGWLDNGKVFDTSRKPGREPFTFTLGQGQVIKGWDEGVEGMKPGGVRELIIPPSIGYGDQDMGTIPPNSTLHFEVELLSTGG